MASSTGIFTLEVNGKSRRFQLTKVLHYDLKIASEITHSELPKAGNGGDFVVKYVRYELSTNASERLLATEKVHESLKRLCKLDHPNVLTCIYADLDKDSLAEKFLIGVQIMHHSPNGDFSAYMKKLGRFTNEQIKHFSYQLLQGIHYLHSYSSITSKGIIHGDLKPSNTIVFADPSRPYGVVLKIMDLDHHATLKQTVTKSQDGKAVVGTYRYMSPEMLLKQSNIGRQTDIWSFGCIVLAMICGHESFEFIYRDPGFSDPFDPMIKTTQFQTVTDPERDCNYHGGTTVPRVPETVTDMECKDFLGSCLTVDLQKRARTETLLRAPWLNGAHMRPALENASPSGCVVPLYRHESWVEDLCDHTAKEAHNCQWLRGINCAGLLLMHSLQSAYQLTLYHDFRDSLLQQLRERPFSNKHMEMCISHLTAFIPTLSKNEQASTEKVIDRLERNKSENGTMRQFYPVLVSLQTLANCMNKFYSEDEQSYSVRTNLDWKDIQSSLDRKCPVICQVSCNEVDQSHDVLYRASMFSLRRICPSKLIELDFVIVSGYLETVNGHTLVQIITPTGSCSEITLAQFDAIWNWRASDPLMRKYLALENIVPASALFCYQM